MKKVLIIITTILILAVLAGLSYLMTLDGKYKVTRQIEIETTSENISSIVANLNSWPHWNPWICLDATAKVHITGTGKDIGNIYAWNGELIGSGELEHKEIYPNKQISQEIRFKEPFESKASILFTFKPSDNNIIVKWEMDGEMPFLFRFLKDQMVPLIGNDFDRGLRMLKDYAETGTIASKIKIKGIENYKGCTFLGKRENCKTTQIGTKMKQTFYEVGNWLVASSTFPNDGISLYHHFDLNSTDCEYTTGFKLDSINTKFPYSGAIIDSIPSGKVIRIVFEGNYIHLGNAWTAAYMYMQQNNIKADSNRPPFEIYLNDPAFFPNPADWITEVYIPIK